MPRDRRRPRPYWQAKLPDSPHTSPNPSNVGGKRRALPTRSGFYDQDIARQCIEHLFGRAAKKKTVERGPRNRTHHDHLGFDGSCDRG
jgi:hypothetical protein